MKMKIMKRIKYLLLSTMMLTMTSCAELFETFISGELQLAALNDVQLSHHKIDLLVGDTILFKLALDPDTFNVQQPTCRWTLSDPETEAVSMIGKRLIARNPGEVEVFLEAVPPGLSIDDVPVDSVMRDSCEVTVARRVKTNYLDFPHEMIIIARLERDGVAVTDSATVSKLQAVIDDEVRGHGIVRKAFGVHYVELIIYGDELGEQGLIEYLDHDNLQRYPFTEFEFDGNTHGTLSDPIVFNIVTTNDAPLWRLETSSKVH
jgi:hypothetical protein